MNENNLIAFSTCLSCSILETVQSIDLSEEDAKTLFHLYRFIIARSNDLPFVKTSAFLSIASAADKFAQMKWQEACEATRESMINESGVMPEYR